MSVKPLYIDCLRDGVVIKTLELGEPIGMLPGAPLDQKALEAQAKEALTNNRIVPAL
jgi:hypothetical protein